MNPRKFDPILVAILVGLVGFALVFWGYTAEHAAGFVGRVERTRARLNDGVCIFAADIKLTGGFGKFEFDRHRLDIRDALIEILRRKSSYMVDSPIARAALRSQMVQEVNRIVHRRVALGLTFSQFDLF
jgi:flagellar basal body-associated protein FliL